MKISDCVGKDKKVTFEFYRSGELFYRCDNGFVFPVPIDDVGTAAMLASDKSVYFMRWIRKFLAVCEAEKAAQNESN